jgi:hypothetical protein
MKANRETREISSSRHKRVNDGISKSFAKSVVKLGEKSEEVILPMTAKIVKLCSGKDLCFSNVPEGGT